MANPGGWKFRYIWLLRLILIAAVTSPVTALAAGPLIVNITNPTFRKMVAANPPFLIRKNTGTPQMEEIARDAVKELNYLLNFSGLFNIMSVSGYEELVARMQQELDKDGSGALKPGQGAIDVVQWKAMGVECLTVGEVVRGSDGVLALEIRTVDLPRNQVLVGKRISHVKRKDIPEIMRKYVNQLLEKYTNKPGIFSSKIVFIGRRSKGTPKQVFIADFDGRNVLQLTRTRATHVSPSWSPDGRYLVFTSYERRNPDLFLYDLQTGRKRLLSGSQGINSGGQWAPNGKLVAFTGSVAGDADIYTVDPSRGGGRKKLIRGSGLDVDPTFSPDGKYLAFVSGRFGNPHIFLATLAWNGDDSVRVVSDKRLTYAGWYNSTPSWSPSGEKLAFAGYDKDIDRYDIFIMDYNGRNLERLTLKTGDNESPDFSPNGQMVIFNSNRIGNKNIKGRSQLWIMNADGSSQRKIETGLYEAQTPAWSPPMY